MTQAANTRQYQFNPNEHLMQLKHGPSTSEYLPVQWRLVWFRELCPQGTIDTEEIEVDQDRECEVEVYVWNPEKRRSEKVMKYAKGYARFKAVVTDGKGGRASGTKSECRASFEDYIEKAETGAIGRALAGLGYGTQFAPELNEGERIVDAPVERSTSNAVQEGNTKPTEQQLASIRKLCEHLKQSVPVVANFEEAKDWIVKLGQEYRTMRQKTAASGGGK